MVHFLRQAISLSIFVEKLYVRLFWISLMIHIKIGNVKILTILKYRLKWPVVIS